MGSEKVETVMVNEGGEPQSKIEVHDLGFVKLLDVMGNDEEVEDLDEDAPVG